MEGPIETFKGLLQGSWTLQTRPKLHKVLGDTLGLRDWVMTHQDVWVCMWAHCRLEGETEEERDILDGKGLVPPVLPPPTMGSHLGEGPCSGAHLCWILSGEV